MHAGDWHDGLDGLRLNAGIALEATNARSGQEHQLLVRGHQPRALDTPLHALKGTSVHATVPCLAHFRGAPSACQRRGFMSRLMSYAAAGS